MVYKQMLTGERQPHTLAPKAPFIHTAESRSRSRGTRLDWNNNETTKSHCAGMIQVGVSNRLGEEYNRNIITPTQYTSLSLQCSLSRRLLPLLLLLLLLLLEGDLSLPATLASSHARNDGMLLSQLLEF